MIGNTESCKLGNSEIEMKLSLTNMRGRTLAFLGSAGLIAATVFALRSAGHLAIGGDYSSQIVLLPLLCGYLLWNEREQIFAMPQTALRKGVQLASVALIIGMSAAYFRIANKEYLFSVASLLSAIVLVVASFLTFYGWAVLRRAVFPLSMLLLAIPLPDSAVQGIISVLQAQSASLSAMLFSIIGIPVYKQGFSLVVPGVTIEVARECSGINSSIALVLTMLLIARQSLKSNWRRLVLVAVAIPLSILKNAIRITTLTVLAVHVDRSFLTGKLHHQGGFVFYLLAMGLMYPLWRWLKRGDPVGNTGDLQTVQMSFHHTTADAHTGASR
jgi:exosortase